MFSLFKKESKESVLKREPYIIRNREDRTWGFKRAFQDFLETPKRDYFVLNSGEYNVRFHGNMKNELVTMTKDHKDKINPGKKVQFFLEDEISYNQEALSALVNKQKVGQALSLEDLETLTPVFGYKGIEKESGGNIQVDFWVKDSERFKDRAHFLYEEGGYTYVENLHEPMIEPEAAIFYSEKSRRHKTSYEDANRRIKNAIAEFEACSCKIPHFMGEKSKIYLQEKEGKYSLEFFIDEKPASIRLEHSVL